MDVECVTRDAAGNVVKTEKMTAMPTFYMNTRRQKAAQEAAAKACADGKTPDEQFAAARAAWQQVRDEDAKAATEKAPAARPAPDNQRDWHRYALAIARLGHGQFESLTTAELCEVASLVKLPVQNFDDWKCILDGE